MTPDLQARLVACFRQGAHINAAAGACGIRREVVHRWVRLGEDDADGVYGSFAAAVHQAFAQYELELLRVLLDAVVAGDVRASMWLLERRFPTRWGPKPGQSLTTAAKGWKPAAWLLERRFPDRWGRTQVKKRASSPQQDVMREFLT